MTRAEMAVAGREYWLHIKEKYQPDEETGLIIMQTGEPEMVHTSVRLIPVYLKRKYLKRVILLMDEEMVPEIGAEGIHEMVSLEAAPRIRIEELLSYYRLVQFFHEIAVVSLEEPYGNAHIIGNEGITLENYVKNALYV